MRVNVQARQGHFIAAFKCQAAGGAMKFQRLVPGFDNLEAGFGP